MSQCITAHKTNGFHYTAEAKGVSKGHSHHVKGRNKVHKQGRWTTVAVHSIKKQWKKVWCYSWRFCINNQLLSALLKCNHYFFSSDIQPNISHQWQSFHGTAGQKHTVSPVVHDVPVTVEKTSPVSNNVAQHPSMACGPIWGSLQNNLSSKWSLSGRCQFAIAPDPATQQGTNLSAHQPPPTGCNLASFNGSNTVQGTQSCHRRQDIDHRLLTMWQHGLVAAAVIIIGTLTARSKRTWETINCVVKHMMFTPFRNALDFTAKFPLRCGSCGLCISCSTAR